MHTLARIDIQPHRNPCLPCGNDFSWSIVFNTACRPAIKTILPTPRHLLHLRYPFAALPVLLPRYLPLVASTITVIVSFGISASVLPCASQLDSLNLILEVVLRPADGAPVYCSQQYDEHGHNAQGEGNHLDIAFHKPDRPFLCVLSADNMVVSLCVQTYGVN